MQTGVYKMRKFLTILPIMLIMIFGMISCADNDEEIPDGLQIVRVSERDGYTLYGPEGWVVANDGEIAASYVSKINNTSITFVKAEAPEGSIDEYFEAEMAKLPYTVEILEPNKSTTFGNAEKACSYVYTFEYDGDDKIMKVAVMQIFVEHGEDFFIFTYTSSFTGYDSPADENSEYQIYIEVVREAISEFKFTEKVEEKAENTAESSEEFILVSDKKLSDFELYLPTDAEVVMSSSQVTAKLSDKANITLTKPAVTNVTPIEYLQIRKSELEDIFGEITDIKLEYVSEFTDSQKETHADTLAAFDIGVSADPDIKFGNLEQENMFAYEYSYVYNGSVYHVYQIIGISTWNGYVFIYTATEDEYSVHLDTVDKILEKVIFE